MMTEPPRIALLDVNVLLALVVDTHVHHAVARRRFHDVAGAWATTPVTELGLARLLLTDVVMGRTVAPTEATATLRALRSAPGWSWLADDEPLDSGRIDMSVLGGRGQVTDLHLVALAARHTAVLCTFDARLPRALAPADRRHVAVWSS